MMLRIILDVFSGMPNPHWTLGMEQSMALAAIISGLSAINPAKIPEAPALGYRGFDISGFDGTCNTFRVFNGYVDACGKVMSDDQRTVELWLLQSAQGLLPAELYADLVAEFGGE